MALAKGTKAILAMLGIAYLIFIAVFFYQATIEHGLVPVPLFETGTQQLPGDPKNQQEIEQFAAKFVEVEVVAESGSRGRYRIVELRPKGLVAMIESGKKEILAADKSQASKAEGFAKSRYVSAAQIKTGDGRIVLNKKVELGLMQLELLTKNGIAGKEKVPAYGHGEIIGINATMGFVILNFLVLVALLYGLLWHPITQMLDDRTVSIRKDIEQASASREDAEKLRSRYEQAIENARTEATRMREEKIREGEARKDEIIAKARDESRRIAEDAKEQIETEVSNARKSLRQEIGGLSVEIARNILAREVDMDVHRKMIDEFLRNLETEKV